MFMDYTINMNIKAERGSPSVLGAWSKPDRGRLVQCSVFAKPALADVNTRTTHHSLVNEADQCKRYQVPW